MNYIDLYEEYNRIQFYCLEGIPIDKGVLSFLDLIDFVSPCFIGFYSCAYDLVIYEPTVTPLLSSFQ